MSELYRYDLVNFPNNKVNISKLTNEIDDSSISEPLGYINIVEWPDLTYCDMVFGSALSPTEESTLSGVVSNHDGEPYTGYINGDPESLIISSVGLSSTNSTRWVTKVSGYTNPVSSGTYKISWSYYWKGYAPTSASNPTIDVRVRMYPKNDTPTDNNNLCRQFQKPVYFDGQSIPAYGFSYRYLEDDTYKLSLEYKRDGTAGTVYIADVFVELIKISNECLIPKNTKSGCNQLIAKQIAEAIPLRL